MCAAPPIYAWPSTRMVRQHFTDCSRKLLYRACSAGLRGLLGGSSSPALTQCVIRSDAQRASWLSSPLFKQFLYLSFQCSSELGPSACAGAIAASPDGTHTAVLEHTGTSVVIFNQKGWQQPAAAVALSQLADGPLSERFAPCLAWDPQGSVLALLTTEGQVIVMAGASFVMSGQHRAADLSRTSAQASLCSTTLARSLLTAQPVAAATGEIKMHLPVQAGPRSLFGGSRPVSVVATSAERLLVLCTAGAVHSVEVPSGKVTRNALMSRGRTCGRAIAFNAAVCACAVIGDGNEAAAADGGGYGGLQPSVSLFDLRGRAPKLVRHCKGRQPSVAGLSKAHAWHATFSPDAAFLTVHEPDTGSHVLLTSSAAPCAIPRPEHIAPLTPAPVNDGSGAAPDPGRVESVAWPQATQALVLWSDGALSAVDMTPVGRGEAPAAAIASVRLQAGTRLACVGHSGAEAAAYAMEPEWQDLSGAEHVRSFPLHKRSLLALQRHDLACCDRHCSYRQVALSSTDSHDPASSPTAQPAMRAGRAVLASATRPRRQKARPRIHAGPHAPHRGLAAERARSHHRGADGRRCTARGHARAARGH